MEWPFPRNRQDDRRRRCPRPDRGEEGLAVERLESRQNPSGSPLGALANPVDLVRRFGGGVDEFTFTTRGAAGSADRVSLDFDRGAGQLRLDLLDASGTPLAGVAWRERSQTEIRLLGLPAGSYAVAVSGSGSGIDYRLRIDAPPAPLEVDDRYEPNDTRDTARAIGGVSTSRSVLAILSNDDWYRFDVRAAGSYDAVVSSAASFRADAVLELTDATGRVLASSAGPGGVQALRGVPLPVGTAYLHVAPAAGRPIPRYTLTVTRVATGSAVSGRTPALDGWVNRNISDRALRPLVLAAAADGGVSRTEMLGIFTQVSQSPTVTKQAFASLKALVKDTTVIEMPDFVRNLARKTVLGDPANRTFQGQSLGNLAVGSPASVLMDLVGKWFHGSDPPRGPLDSSTGQPKYPLRTTTGTLFGPSNAAQLADINQGNLGDCYFLSSLGTMVSKGSPVVALNTTANPDGMFIYNPDDGSYTVRFYYKKQAADADGRADRAVGTWVADYVTVDNQFPASGPGQSATWEFANAYAPFNGPNNVLWVAYAEKAFVQENTSRRWGSSDTKNVYEDVSGRYDANVILMALSGQDGYKNTTDLSSLVFQDIVSSYTTGVGVVFGTQTKISVDTADNVPIVTGHDYMMIGYDQAKQTIRLRNPWGILGTEGTYDGVTDTSSSPRKTNLYIDATVSLLGKVFGGYYHI